MSAGWRPRSRQPPRSGARGVIAAMTRMREPGPLLSASPPPVGMRTGIIMIADSDD